MSNIEAARQNARNGAELGDLRRRYNDAHRATLVKSPAERAQDLCDAMDAAKLTGNKAAYLAARDELKSLIELL